jgi:hypothetical protein
VSLLPTANELCSIASALNSSFNFFVAEFEGFKLGSRSLRIRQILNVDVKDTTGNKKGLHCSEKQFNSENSLTALAEERN